MKSKVSFRIVHDKRKQLKNKEGKFPLSLRVTYNNGIKTDNRKYSLGWYIDEGEYEKATSTSPRGKYREMSVKISHIENRAYDLAEELKDSFSFDRFKNSFFGDNSKSATFYGLFEENIKRLEKEGRLKTAWGYNDALVAMKSYKKAIDYNNLTPEFFKALESFWGADKNTSTIAMYMRAIRVVINIAKTKGYISQENYPFGKGKYIIPEGRNIKKAITLSQIKLIYDYQPISEQESFSRDVFMFSYLCNGMTIKDIAKLKYDNLSGNTLSFMRSKTKRSRPIEIKIYLLPQAKVIIDRWGLPKELNGGYIFGIIGSNLSIKQQENAIRDKNKIVNKYLNRIAENVGIEERITTYTARHSFATVMKRSGKSAEFIGEQLGHGSIETTKKYLASFEEDEVKKAQQNLLNFS